MQAAESIWLCGMAARICDLLAEIANGRLQVCVENEAALQDRFIGRA